MSSLSKVKLGLGDQLKHRDFRSRFFRTLAQESIASQLRYMREKRGMRQADLALAADTKQPVISRLEQAGYAGWTFGTLMKLGDALDARVSVVIEPSEEAIARLQDDGDQMDAKPIPTLPMATPRPVTRTLEDVAVGRFNYAN